MGDGTLSTYGLPQGWRPGDPRRTDYLNIKTGDTEQNINVVDIICEGPIKGLVSNGAGVYLNDTEAEYTELAEYMPEDFGSTSGTITFDGSSNTGNVSTEQAIPLDLVHDATVPRQIVLHEYKSIQVTVAVDTTLAGNEHEEEGNLSSHKFNLSALTGGTQFDSSWYTNVGWFATLVREGVAFSGYFRYTAGETPSFLAPSGGAAIDLQANTTYTLNIAEIFDIQTLATGTTPQTVTTVQTPVAGTYKFVIARVQTVRNEAHDIDPSTESNQTNKIEDLQIYFNNGSINQNSLPSIEGVGEGVSIPGNSSLITLPELKMISSSAASTMGISGQIPANARGGMPSGSGSDDFNDGPTVLPSGAFGVDTAAKRNEADEIAWSIKYNALQAISLTDGKKQLNYAFYLMEIQLKRGGVWEVDSLGKDVFYSCFPNVNVNSHRIIHEGNTTASINYDHVMDLNQFRPFDDFKVRIVRISRHIGLPVSNTGAHSGNQTDEDKWNMTASAAVHSPQAVIKDKFRYPYTATASLFFSSKQFSSEPKRSYLLRGKLVAVPKNYTPREYTGTNSAEYDGFWDGTFRPFLMYTDNPAWVFFDICLNNRYGAGKWLTSTELDKYNLYRIARYCDDLVDDGKGGLEPRFRANLYLTKATDIYKVLKDIATTFLGMLYWLDNKLTLTYEHPQDPIYNFSTSNVIDGKFTYETTGAKTRINQVVVSWNDPEINYEQTPLIVEDRDSIVKTGKIISENSVAFGATSESQAIRYGRWKLWTAQNQTEIVAFQTSYAAQYLRPGDVINVQDANRFGTTLSGRVSSVDTSATPHKITLDRNITLSAGYTYELDTLVTEPAAFWTGVDDLVIIDTSTSPNTSYTFKQGERVTHAYVASGTSTFTFKAVTSTEDASNAFKEANKNNPLSLTWKNFTYVQTNIVNNSQNTLKEVTLDSTSSTFGVVPVRDTVWAIRELDSDGNLTTNSSRKFKILDIEEDKAEFSIRAVEFYNEKYAAVEKDYRLGTLPTTIFPNTEPRVIPPPRNLRILVETNAGSNKDEISLEWDAPLSDEQHIKHYEIFHNIPGLSNPLTSSSTSYKFETLPVGIIVFNVKTISRKGNVSRGVGLRYEVLNDFSINVTRVQELIPRGVIASSTLLEDEGTGKLLRFEVDPTVVVSVGDDATSSAIYMSDTVNVSGIHPDSVNDSNTLYHILLDGSFIRLVYYDTYSLENLSYWRLISDSDSRFTSQSAKWTSVTPSSDTASVSAESNRLVGTGTSWLTALKPKDIIIFGENTDLIKRNLTSVTEGADFVQINFTTTSAGSIDTGYRIYLDETAGSTELNNRYFFLKDVSVTQSGADYNYTAKLCTDSSLTLQDPASITAYTSGGYIRNSPHGAVVTSVLSDTQAFLDRTFPHALSAVNVRRRTFRPNVAADSIFAAVKHDGTDFVITRWIQLDPLLNVGKFVNVIPSTPTLQYQSDGTQINAPGSITLTATAVGFKAPKFRVSAVTAGITNLSATSSFDNPDDAGGFVKTYTADSDGVIPYRTGSPETITIQVAETSNTANTVSGSGLITKTAGGAEGVSGRTAFLSSEDYSIIYNEAGTNPSYTGSSNNVLDFTTTAQNFTTPEYRYTFIGGVGVTAGDFTLTRFNSFSTNATCSVGIPAAHTSWVSAGSQDFMGTFQVKVELREQGETTVQAFDIVTIQGIKPVAGGYWVSLSNEAHTIPSSRLGVPNGTADSNGFVPGAGSGTTIEVGRGVDILDYTSGTPAEGQYSISVVDSPSSAIDVSTPNTSNAKLISYGDHGFHNTAWVQDTAEIAYTITLETSGNTIVRRQTFSKSKAGFGGIHVTNSNPVQAVPATAHGKVISLAGTGVSLNVGLSGDSLPYYENVGEATANNAVNYWILNGGEAPSGVNITTGAIGPDNRNGSTAPITFADHSNFLQAQSTASITYPIEVRLGSATETFDTVQTFRKNTNSTAVYLTATTTQLEADAAGTILGGQNYTLNWTTIVPDDYGTPHFKLYTSTSGTQLLSDSTATSYTPSSSVAQTYIIALYPDNTLTDPPDATDRQTIGRVKSGAGAVSTDLTTDATVQVYTKDSSGTFTSLLNTITATIDVAGASDTAVYQWDTTGGRLPGNATASSTSTTSTMTYTFTPLGASATPENPEFKVTVSNLKNEAGTALSDVTKSLTIPAHKATEGADGVSGFFYFTQNNNSAPYIYAAPINGQDVISPPLANYSFSEGQIAIVTNTENVQKAYRFNGTTWQALDGIMNTGVIFANAIGAEQLQISADNETTAASMFFDGTASSGPRILINDAGGTLRVKLGKLS